MQVAENSRKGRSRGMAPNPVLNSFVSDPCFADLGLFFLFVLGKGEVLEHTQKPSRSPSSCRGGF